MIDAAAAVLQVSPSPSHACSYLLVPLFYCVLGGSHRFTLEDSLREEPMIDDRLFVLHLVPLLTKCWQQTMITRVLAPGSLFICSFIIFPFLDMVSMRSCSSCNFLLIYLYRHQKEKERLTAAARLLFHYLVDLATQSLSSLILSPEECWHLAHCSFGWSLGDLLSSVLGILSVVSDPRLKSLILMKPSCWQKNYHRERLCLKRRYL